MMLLQVFLFALIGQLCTSTRRIREHHHHQHQVQGHCDQGYHEVGKACLKQFLNQLNYYDAYRVCRNQGGNLLTGSRRSIISKMNRLRLKKSEVQGNYWTSSYSKGEYGVWFRQYPRKRYGLAVVITGRMIDLKPALRTLRMPFICEKRRNGHWWKGGHRQHKGKWPGKVSNQKDRNDDNIQSNDKKNLGNTGFRPQSDSSSTALFTSNFLLYLSFVIATFFMTSNC